MNLLWEGARGRPVEALQRLLADKGYYGGRIDGVFGARTHEAVAEFQRDHRLRVDGVVGPQTARALDMPLGRAQAAAVPGRPPRDKVFISYSHADAKWLKMLQVHLAALERAGAVERWDDTMIGAGTRWREQIAEGLQRAKVGVLLVSPYFMASEFIASHELPQLLAAQGEGLAILPVIISPCVMGELADYQAVNPPSRPLVDLNRGDRDRVWVQVVEQVTAALND